MKSRTLIAALVAATLGLSSLSAFAQSYDRRTDVRVIVQPVQHVERRDDRRDDRVERRDDRRDNRAERREDRRNDRFDRRHDRRDARDDRRDNRRYHHYNARSPEFRRGRYIPPEFRHRQYVVVNHRSHRLSAPPRGHQWVQVGTDYVMIAVATGLIAHIVLNH